MAEWRAGKWLWIKNATAEEQKVFLCRVPMLQIILRWVISFYTIKNRWWLPLITGLPFSFCLPPFNHELHWIFSPFPFLSFIALLPFLFFSVQQSRGRAILHTYLFSCSVTLGQYFWIAFVTIEGLWVLIIIGMILLSAFVALFYAPVSQLAEERR